MSDARELWKRIETIHAVTYFSSESIDRAKQLGLRGFWMGYFGFRAAPLGAASSGTIHATFANFARPMIERAVPDVWSFATPAQLIDARASAAATALRRLAPAQIDAASAAASALHAVIDHADPLGRPLFAANRALAARSDPVEELWQACTTLREHRGDSHVAALAVHHIDGCQAHRLHAAAHLTPHEVLRDNRGFGVEDWADAGDQLAERGLLDGSRLTESGRELVDRVESLTDELAQVPLDRSGLDIETLVDPLEPMVRHILDAGVLPFPNPMGLPAD